MYDFLKKPFVLLTTFYSLAWGQMLFLRADYWDGWILLSQFAHPDLHWLYTLELAPQRLYHYYALARFAMFFPDPILTTRVLIFSSWLAAGFILFLILRRFLKWNQTAALLVTLYYLIFPTFFVRFELFLVCYSLANVLFLLGCYLSLDLSAQGLKRFVREALAIVVFLFSFLVNSFPIFFFGFLTVHVYQFAQQHSYHTVRSIAFAWLRKYFYLLILPILFLAIKVLYFKPYGYMSAYNEPIIFRADATVVSTIYALLHGFWSGMYIGVIWPLARSLILLERKYFVLALTLAVLVVYLLFKRYKTLIPDVDLDAPFALGRIRVSKACSVVAAGALLCLLGLFPYVMVGKPPHVYGYGFGLRHTLLFPLGTALLIFGLVAAMFRANLQKNVHIAILSMSLAFCWYNFFLLDMDWYKQQAIIRGLSPILADAKVGTLFVFNDEVSGLNWNSRNIPYQEYDGYFELLTGTRDYLGVDKRIFDRGDYIRNPTVPSAPIKTMVPVTISSRRTDDPRLADWIPIKFSEIFRSDEQFGQMINDKLQVELKTSTSVPFKN